MYSNNRVWVWKCLQ